MRARILQRKGHQRWFDDAYAYENSEGQLKFRANPTWEKIPLYWLKKLEETGVSLDQIETVLMPGDPQYWRWLPIEECNDGEEAAFLKTLNDRCYIPQSKRTKTNPNLISSKA